MTLTILLVIVAFIAGILVGSKNSSKIKIDVANLRQDLADGIAELKALHAKTAADVTATKAAVHR